MTEPRKPITNADVQTCDVCGAYAPWARKDPDNPLVVQKHCTAHKPADVRIEREGEKT